MFNRCSGELREWKRLTLPPHFEKVSHYGNRKKNQSLRSDGGGTHYGKIRNIVKDMFDGSILYVVEVKGVEKTYKEESLLPLRKEQKKVRKGNERKTLDRTGK